MSEAQVWQLMRILGKNEFLACLSLQSEDQIRSIEGDQMGCIQDLARRNVRKITRLFIHDAIADDNVQTSEQAQQFLEQRLAFFGELLPNDVKSQIRQHYSTMTAMWGETS